MKKIGLISDKKSKKVFLLPEQIKTLTNKNIEVFVNAGYAKNLNIADDKYLTAGAKICKKSSEVLEKADIIFKTNAFDKGEIAKCPNKIMVSFANYVVNANMILQMLKSNVTGLAWNCLADKDGYVFFKEFETIKGRHCINQMVWAWANKGLGLTNANVCAKRPKVLILNYAWAAFEAVKACLANNIDVTVLDNDLASLKDLTQMSEIKELSKIYGATVKYDDAKFETLMKHFATHNGFINTCIDPVSKTKVRITPEMVKAMPSGSFIIDAACENGYGFGFQKDFVKEKENYKQFEGVTYSCVADITDLYPLATSQVLSSKSVNYIISLCEKGVDANTAISNVIVTENGKVVNSNVKTQLRLY